MDYTLANVPGMEFGSAFITDKAENLAAASVAAGWAKVKLMPWPVLPRGCALGSSLVCQTLRQLPMGIATSLPNTASAANEDCGIHVLKIHIIDL